MVQGATAQLGWGWFSVSVCAWSCLERKDGAVPAKQLLLSGCVKMYLRNQQGGRGGVWGWVWATYQHTSGSHTSHHLAGTGWGLLIYSTKSWLQCYISAFGDVFYCQKCHHLDLDLSWKCTALLGELGHWSWCWSSADTKPLVQLQGEMFLVLKLCPVTAGFAFHLRGSLC